MLTFWPACWAKAGMTSTRKKHKESSGMQRKPLHPVIESFWGRQSGMRLWLPVSFEVTGHTVSCWFIFSFSIPARLARAQNFVLFDESPVALTDGSWMRNGIRFGRGLAKGGIYNAALKQVGCNEPRTEVRCRSPHATQRLLQQATIVAQKLCLQRRALSSEMCLDCIVFAHSRVSRNPRGYWDQRGVF